jgi:hypothetical protein
MPAWTTENISFMTKLEEGIGWRIGQLRQRMGVAPGKDVLPLTSIAFFFLSLSPCQQQQ